MLLSLLRLLHMYRILLYVSSSILMQRPHVTVTTSSDYRSEHLLIFLNLLVALLSAGSRTAEFGRSPSFLSSLLLLPAKCNLYTNHTTPLDNPRQTIPDRSILAHAVLSARKNFQSLLPWYSLCLCPENEPLSALGSCFTSCLGGLYSYRMAFV